MTIEENDDLLPDILAAKEFYAKYEPKEILGRGVSSTVRRCVEKETGVEYAAKIIDISANPGSLASTREEIRILRLVAGHPYIINLHDVFESTTFIFLVFEICKRGELFDYLTTVVTLPEKKTRTVMKQLLEALDYVHGKDIVHRDLKPENILLDEAGNIKLTDFGFACELKKNEELTDLLGTPGYLAPEVIKINMYTDVPGYSYQVDLWACGVIMYTLLVGFPPFWHRKQIIMFRNIMEGNYSFACPEWADISDEAKDLISRLLVVDVKLRLTVKQALEHPFFNVIMWDQNMTPMKHRFSVHSRNMTRILQITKAFKSYFDPKKKFRIGIYTVLAACTLKKLITLSKPVSIEESMESPYKVRSLRKVIDMCAFGVYGHWVKKGEGQNRAALFEMSPKTELKALYIQSMDTSNDMPVPPAKSRYNVPLSKDSPS